MTPDERLFDDSTYRVLDPPRNIYLGNESIIKALHYYASVDSRRITAAVAAVATALIALLRVGVARLRQMPTSSSSSFDRVPSSTPGLASAAERCPGVADTSSCVAAAATVLIARLRVGVARLRQMPTSSSSFDRVPSSTPGLASAAERCPGVADTSSCVAAAATVLIARLRVGVARLRQMPTSSSSSFDRVPSSTPGLASAAERRPGVADTSRCPNAQNLLLRVVAARVLRPPSRLHPLDRRSF
ncbi:hypothetical protein EV714DRAFT_277843 [Schizophyllum commune]